VLLIATHEATDGIHTQERRGIEDAQQERVLLLSGRGIVVKQVVEVREIGNSDAGCGNPLFDALGA
jgi:hypothetical protein